MKVKEYEMSDGRKAVFEYDENGVGKITLECMDELMEMVADRPQGEFTKREYEQFLHGISLSLLSKRSAQHWGYEEETAQKIRWLEALEQKVRAKMKGADNE